MSESLILTAEGRRAAPSWFSNLLEAFDPNLRVVWGLGQAVPFPGWVIERRIPDAMKAKVYSKKARYADQVIVDQHGNRTPRRYDMQPDWHPVYRVVNILGEPVYDLDENVINYLRRNYDRTLLGFPELSLQHCREDDIAAAAAQAKKDEDSLDRAAQLVEDHKREIFSDVLGFVGQPTKILEGSEV